LPPPASRGGKRIRELVRRLTAATATSPS
jgi:hypothetical protein